MEPYIKTRPGGGNFFTHWDDTAVHQAIKKTHDAGKPVILIGHSWGGSDAIAAAKWARDNDIPIKLLITIDPVGNPNYLIWSPNTCKGIANNWVAVIADKPGIQPGDVVANAWGKTPMGVLDKANKVIHDTDAGHAEFGKMLANAGAETLIANVYKANK